MQRAVSNEKHPDDMAAPTSPSDVLTETSQSDISPAWLSTPVLSAGSSPLDGGSHYSAGQPSPLGTPALVDSPEFSARSLYFDMDIEAGMEYIHIPGEDAGSGITDTHSGGGSLCIDKDETGLRWIQNGSSLLHIAAEQGHADVLRLLLAHGGIDINGRNMNGLVPLQLAVSAGRVEIVQLLLDHGADITL
jgi:hypothetical protein